MIPQFPVYLFDIDGTLLDSAQDICGAVQQVIANNGGPPQTFEFLRSFIGFHLKPCFAAVFPSYNPDQIEDLVEQYRQTYRARGHKMTHVFPGVAEGLAALGGRKSTATTKGTPTTRLVLETFGLIQYFEHVQGTDGFPCKPEPNVIFTALAAMGARPEDCMMVGDSTADIEAGKAAGVVTCAVRWGYGDRQAMERLRPDYWIENLSQLAGQ